MAQQNKALLDLVEKMRCAVCDQDILLRFIKENVDDPSTCAPLIRSAARFNDDLFAIHAEFEQLAANHGGAKNG